MFGDLEHIARLRLHDPDYKPPAPSGYDFGGFDLPYDSANLLELWLKWEENAFMPEPGGFFDQPPEWHEMIHVMRRMYNIIAHQVELKIRARHPDNG